MTVTFGFEYGTSQPATGDVLKGLFYPWCSNCDQRALLQAVGIIGKSFVWSEPGPAKNCSFLGAIIMPHNFYLHSALVKSRDVDRSRSEKVREANLYYFIECSVAIFVSLIINIFVLAVFAHGLYLKTNKEVVSFTQSYFYKSTAMVFSMILVPTTRPSMLQCFQAREKQLISWLTPICTMEEFFWAVHTAWPQCTFGL